MGQRFVRGLPVSSDVAKKAFVFAYVLPCSRHEIRYATPRADFREGLSVCVGIFLKEARNNLVPFIGFWECYIPLDGTLHILRRRQSLSSASACPTAVARVRIYATFRWLCWNSRPVLR